MMKRWQIAPLLLILGMGLAHAADPDPNAILGKKETAQTAALPTVAQPAEMDPKTNARLVEISRQLRCLVCQNESIADSMTEAAVELRRETAELISQGKTDQEVIDTIVDRYGEVVLYNPAIFKGGLIRPRRKVVHESAERQAQVALAREMLSGKKPFDAEALKGKPCLDEKEEH